MSSDYDVIIIGGGMTGLTLGLALGKLQLRVMIVEGQPFQFQHKITFDVRVSAITRASQHIFENLGVWQEIKRQRISPFEKMEVWDAMGQGSIHFDCQSLREKNLGFIIENQVIQHALLEKLKHCASVKLICPAKIKSYSITSDHVVVTLDDGQVLNAKLLVGADGAHSKVRMLSGISVTSWDYEHHALVATVKTENSHDATAWQRFLPSGPLAFLPLAEKFTSSIVWSTSQAQAEALQKMNEEEFKPALEIAFDRRLGKVDGVGERFIFPLTMRHADSYIQPRIALIGDAAHTLHPLAGQGVNLGLLDAAALAEVISCAVAYHREIGSHATLRRYERARKGHNLMMIMAMEGFKQLFGSSLSPVVWLRDFGLNMTDNLSFLKNTFMRHAMGVSGDLPELAKAKQSGHA